MIGDNCHFQYIHMGCRKLALWELGSSIENNNVELFGAYCIAKICFQAYDKDSYICLKHKFAAVSPEWIHF